MEEGWEVYQVGSVEFDPRLLLHLPHEQDCKIADIEANASERERHGARTPLLPPFPQSRQPRHPACQLAAPEWLYPQALWPDTRKTCSVRRVSSTTQRLNDSCLRTLHTHWMHTAAYRRNRRVSRQLTCSVSTAYVSPLCWRRMRTPTAPPLANTIPGSCTEGGERSRHEKLAS